MRYLIFIILCVSIVFGKEGTVPGKASGSLHSYSVDGTVYEGYYVSPSENAPLILLVHDWDGMTAYEVERSEMLAKLGYAVFAVDLFGKGVRPSAVADKKRLTGALYKDRERMRRLMDSAGKAAKVLGANLNNAIVVGYCFGGAVVLEVARAGVTYKGFVAFHGGLATPRGQGYSQVKGSVLVFHGSADNVVSMTQFAELTTALESNGVSHEMITYSGAPHAFSVFGSKRYRKDADEKSWRRFIEWLSETLR